jgi:hypothetical protein
MSELKSKTLLVFILFLVLLTSRATLAEISDNSKSTLLIGKSIATEDSAVESIQSRPAWLEAAAHRSVMTYWNSDFIKYPGISSTRNLLSRAGQKSLSDFSRSALKDAYAKTRTVFYPFSGPDFPYPNTLFPNMRELVLVGLENIGALPDVEKLDHEGRLENVMREVADAYVYLPERSYFVTRRMAVMLKEFGITTMLSVGLVATDNKIVEIQKISLDRTGAPTADDGKGIHGVVIHYQRPDQSPGSIYYFRQDLSNSGLARSPELELFLSKQKIDTVYYKAAQFLSFSGNFSKLNEFVLDHANYIVESDDGLPFHFLADSTKWNTEIFGLYARPPSHSVGDRFQADFLQEDVLHVCASGQSDLIKDLERIWSSPDICRRYTGRSPKPGIRWGGFIPFPYGYGYRFTPVPTDLHPVTSNLIYSERK